jgi:hypothetical protein
VQPLLHDAQPRGVLRLFRVSHNRAAAYEPRDAIFPGYQAPVVRVDTGDDHLPLELPEHGEHTEHGAPHWRRRVESLGMDVKADARLADGLQDLWRTAPFREP